MCDSLCLIGPGGLQFAKNSDRPPTEVQVFEAYGPRASGGTLRTQYLEIPDRGAAALVGSRPQWLWGLEHGLNEHGVAIGNEKIWTTGRPNDRPPALLGMDIVRLGLERSRDASDALAVMTDLVEHHGQGGSGEPDHGPAYDSSFLIADATEAWILETCDRTWAARRLPAGGAISNRVSLDRDWTRASADVPLGSTFQDWRSPAVPTAIADHRLAATTACVDRGAGAVTPESLVATLRDHGSGPWGAPGSAPTSVSMSAPGTGAGADTEPAPHPVPREPGPDYLGVTVCMHVRGHQVTTASMVCRVGPDATEQRAWVALGSPCVSVYVPLFPAVGVPAALSAPSTWRRFAALRDRVDANPTLLSRIRTQLAPVEAELWARAEIAAGQDHAARVAYTRAAFDPVERVLGELGL